jgi:hypothetical protein
MRKFFFGLAALALLLATAGTSHAAGGQIPVFQAAPWYLYWPYHAHFQTPVPINAPFYGPPIPNNFPANPYFPQAGAPYGMPYGAPMGGMPYGAPSGGMPYGAPMSGAPLGGIPSTTLPAPTPTGVVK